MAGAPIGPVGSRVVAPGSAAPPWGRTSRKTGRQAALVGGNTSRPSRSSIAAKLHAPPAPPLAPSKLRHSAAHQRMVP